MACEVLIAVAKFVMSGLLLIFVLYVSRPVMQVPVNRGGGNTNHRHPRGFTQVKENPQKRQTLSIV